MHKGKRFVEIGAGFIGRASPSRIVAGDSDASAETFVGVFETTDVIALPTMQGNRDVGELHHSRLGIDAEIGILGLGEVVGLGGGF